MKQNFIFWMLAAAFAMVPLSASAQSSGCDEMVLPYSENFDGYTSENGVTKPDCWTRLVPFQVNPGSNAALRPNLTTASGHGKALSFQGQGTVSGVMKIATQHIPAALNNLEILFQMSGAGLRIYAASDTTDESTWALIGAFSTASSFTWKSYELHTDTLVGIPSTEGFLVFAADFGSSGYSTARLDELVIRTINVCNRPNTVTVEQVTPTTAQVSWSAVSGSDEFRVSWSTVDDLDSAQYEELSGNAYTLEELEPNTHYYVWVQTLCGAALSDARTAELTTESSCYPVVNLRQTSASSSMAAFQWEFDERGNTPQGVVVMLVDASDPTADTIMEYSTGDNYHFITGLDNTHQYEVYFFTVCGEEDWSDGIGLDVMFRGCGETMTSLNPGHSINSFPLNTFYNYTYCQMLYRSEDFLDMDTIRGLAVHRDTSKSYTPTTRTLDIYMTNTTLDSLSTPLSVTGMTQVTNGGTLVVGEGEWDTILFSTPFVYNGTGNVIITIDDNTGSNSGSTAAWWRFHPSNNGKIFVSMADNFNINPATPSFPSTGYSSPRNYLPDLHFVGVCQENANCEAPVAAAGYVDTTFAEITWMGGAGDEYVIEYRTEGAQQWIVSGTATGTPYTLGGLTPGTRYEARVGVVCGQQTRYSGSVTFATICAPVAVPFHFTQNDMVATVSSGFTPCWSFSSNMRRGTLSADSHRGYVRNVGNNQWLMLPAIEGSLQGTRFRTWAGVGSDTDIKIGVATQSDCSDVEWLDTVTLPGSNVNEDHVELIYYFDDYEGDATRIVVSPLIPTEDAIFVYFFDFHVEVVDCRPVTNLTLDSTDASTMSISWTPVSQATGWAVYVDGQRLGVATEPHYTIQGLDPYATYMVAVRGICPDGDTAAATSATFRSGCEGEGCTFTVNATTTGSGWQSAYLGIAVQVGDSITDFDILGSVTMVNPTPVSRTFTVCAGMPVHFSWSSGNNDAVCMFDIVNEAGEVIYHSVGGMVDPAYPHDQDNLGPSFYVDSNICATSGHGPVGIAEVEESRVMLFPNPASNVVTIAGIADNAQVSIIDLNGREVYNQKANGSRLQVNVDGFAKGAYFVRVVSEKNNVIRKLIVK